MTNRNGRLILGFILLLCAFFISCNFENPIIEKWWAEEEPAEEEPESEPEYISITKYIPEIYYYSIIEHDIVYETVYETITEQLPPEIIYEMIYIQLPPEVITEIVYETKYVEVPVEVEKVITITLPPDKETFIQWLENDATDDDIKVIKEIIKEYLTVEDIKEIIQKIPPEELISYLTNDQIEYIIKNQPPKTLLQSIKIIDIEYIIFAGGAEDYNGPPVPSNGTALTAQLKSTNDSIVNATIKTLKENPNSLVLLHGHANPVTNEQSEIDELKALSLARANSVKQKIISTALDLDSGRMDTKGFAGDGNIVSSTSNAELNRRVEVILFEIDTTTVASGG